MQGRSDGLGCSREWLVPEMARVRRAAWSRAPNQPRGSIVLVRENPRTHLMPQMKAFMRDPRPARTTPCYLRAVP